MTEPLRRPLRSADGARSGEVVHVAVAGERGSIQLFAVMLDHPLNASGRRQDQVRQLVQFVAGTASRRDLVLVCGDFNAGPDSDELRMLTGRSAPAVPGMVFYDAWEVAGDGSPGFTWSNRNPLAAVGLYPDRRFDYIFSAWPWRGGPDIRHVARCSASARRVSSRFLTITGWRPTFVTERHGVSSCLRRRGRVPDQTTGSASRGFSSTSPRRAGTRPRRSRVAPLGRRSSTRRASAGRRASRASSPRRPSCPRCCTLTRSWWTGRQPHPRRPG